MESLHNRSFIDARFKDLESDLVEGFVDLFGPDLRTGDDAQGHLADIDDDGLRCKPQGVDGPQGGLATNLVHDTVGLLGRNTDITRLRLDLH